MNSNADASPEQSGDSSPEQEGLLKLMGKANGLAKHQHWYIYPSENLQIYTRAESIGLAPERWDKASDVTVAGLHPDSCDVKSSEKQIHMDLDKEKVEVEPASGICIAIPYWIRHFGSNYQSTYSPTPEDQGKTEGDIAAFLKFAGFYSDLTPPATTNLYTA